MRKWLVILGGGLLLLAGCASSPRGAVLYGSRLSNLALGPSGEHAWLSERVAPRSGWPSAVTGLRLDAVTYYDRVIFDEESHYNRYGSVYHRTQTVETGVWLR